MLEEEEDGYGLFCCYCWLSVQVKGCSDMNTEVDSREGFLNEMNALVQYAVVSNDVLRVA